MNLSTFETYFNLNRKITILILFSIVFILFNHIFFIYNFKSPKWPLNVLKYWIMIHTKSVVKSLSPIQKIKLFLKHEFKFINYVT